MPPRPDFGLDPEFLRTLQEQAAAEGRDCLVGGLIANSSGEIFVQKRAPHQRLFPNRWDIAGGHVEPGETLYQALEREIQEETGWELTHILALVCISDWEIGEASQVIQKREFDFLVRVKGDLEHPTLEVDKFTEFRWVGPAQLEILTENRAKEDRLIFNLIQKSLELLHRL
jgi:8-oxo-dGTP diphosphatase